MKTYSVWVRINGVKAESLKQAEKKVEGALKSFVIKGVILKKLNRDFYPTEK